MSSGHLLLSLPFLAVFWLLVQHEPVVLMTQNVFLIVAIVSLILYSMVHTKQEPTTRSPTPSPRLPIVSGICAVVANLHPVGGIEALADEVLYLSILLILGFVVYGFLTHYSPEFGRTVVLMILILSTVVFWALFEQSAGSMTLYADRVVDRSLGNTTFTAAQFGSLNAGFIMLLAIPFAALWTWLAKKNLEPNTPSKVRPGHHAGRSWLRRPGSRCSNSRTRRGRSR